MNKTAKRNRTINRSVYRGYLLLLKQSSRIGKSVNGKSIEELKELVDKYKILSF